MPGVAALAVGTGTCRRGVTSGRCAAGGEADKVTVSNVQR